MTLSEAQARQHLQELLNKYQALSESERKGRSEADVVAQFIVPLLRDVLGWPTEDPARYRYEMVTEVGRPDMVLTPAQGGVVFVEAKRFGVIKELEQARKQIEGVIRPAQMGLPGLAVDRTPEEQQAINYAFANGGTWAILTNFEKLRLFNARRDWLVLSFETPSAFLLEFDQLWQLAYANVVQGSLEPLSNQRFARDIDSAYLDFINEWRLRLARDIARRRKQNPWAFNADGSIRLHDLRAVVQRYLDRLVIARFAEDWLVIPPGTLRDFQEVRRRNRYSFSLDEFLDKFFRRFDEDHNSALFARGLVDEANFSDEALLPLLEKLYEVRYRAMPADILGNTYEQFLGKALALKDGDVDTRDNLETRKKQGSYYTPQVIVQYIVDHSLGRYLYGTENGQADGKPLPGETRKTSQDIRDLRVLDSACGSGSFLIYAYRVLADFYAGEIKRLEAEGEARRRELTAQGITSPLELQIQLTPYTAEIERIRDYHYLILERHLYGLDLDPQAAEIATVNLIMRAMEGRHQHKLLPLILNQNVKVGNALVGWRAEDERLSGQRPALAELMRLREQVIRELSGTEHDRAQTELEARTAALRAELDEALRGHFSDLERVRPFHWGIEFPEVFYNDAGTVKEQPGFTIIFGNPPWEILKPDLREFYAQFDERIESKYSRAQAEQRIAELDAEEPGRRADFEALNASVGQTTTFLRGSPDYTRQGRGDPATHKLFLERMYGLLRTDGQLGYVIPSGIYTDLGTKELREMLLNEGSIERVIGLTNGISGGEAYFRDIHRSFKITLLSVRKGQVSDGFNAAFRIDPRHVPKPAQLLDFAHNPDNFLYFRRESLARFSPDSLSLMEFQTRRDYAIAEQIYDGWPLVGAENDPHPLTLSERNPHPLTPSPLHGEGEPEGLVSGSGRGEGEGAQSLARSENDPHPLALSERNPHPLTPSPLHGEGEPEGLVSGSGRGEGEGGTAGRRPFAQTYTDSELWEAIKPLARQMRHEPTPAEKVLWEALRNRSVSGYKFRRQHPIDRFVVDFFCAEAHLVIEVDGEIHDYTQEEDALRQAFLESRGLRVLRFHNEAVLSDLNAVLAAIQQAVSSPPLHAMERGPGGENLPWRIKFTREFDITNDRHLFNTEGRGLPLYEGKMIHQYDAFYGEPHYWLEEAAAAERLSNRYGVQAHELDYHKPRLAFRGIARSTDERTLIAALLPPGIFTEGRTATTVIQRGISLQEQLYLVGCLNSYVLDWILRLKVAANINMFYLYSLPLPRVTAGNRYFDAIVPRAARLTCTRGEFAGLWEAVMGRAWEDPHPLTSSEGNPHPLTPSPLHGEGEPRPAVEAGERQRLRDEIDGLVAHLYGLSREDYGHILSSFPLVFPETAAGQARRAAALAAYDAVGE